MSEDLEQACHLDLTSRQTLLEVHASLQRKDADKLLGFLLMRSKFDRAIRERLFESHAAAIRNEDHKTMVRWLDTGNLFSHSMIFSDRCSCDRLVTLFHAR